MAGEISRKLLILITVLLSLTLPSLAYPSPERIAKFNKTYQASLNKWLAPKNETSQECLRQLLTQLNECRTEPYMQMMQYSFHGLGDMGDYHRCQDLDAYSAYAVISLNVSTTPVFIRQGICLPSNCTQGIYNGFSTGVSNTLTNLI